MSFSLVRMVPHRGALNPLILALAVLALTLCSAASASAQGSKNSIQSGQSNLQRLDVMRSKLEAMRRSLDSAIASMNAKDTGDKKKNPDDPRERLRSLDKEVGSVLSEVNDLHSKEDKAEKYDTSKLDTLEESVADLTTRVDASLQATAGARKAGAETASNYHPKPEKTKRRMFGLLPGKSQEKYTELLSGAAPGRDRELFTEATKEVRKGNHDTGRLLFTTIITTYPDSPFLPMAKLAIADSFYLEGTTSSLIQAGQAYQDWLTYFPTDSLTCAAMMKVAETEMRQMGLSDRDITHARKAEQRLKVMLQQCPQSSLRGDADVRLREIQDNLAQHSLDIANYYYQRYVGSKGAKGGLKGVQSRLQEIIDKYPNFCQMDEVLFRQGWTYQQEEEPDEAAKYFQQVVRDFPNSDYVEKAKEQLNIIGASIPEPDPIRKTMPPCEKPTFMQNMMQQITGSAEVTTSHDGILITRRGDGNDLIDKALANNGTLPEGVQPVIQRTAPARPTVPQPQVTTPTPTDTTAPDKKKIGIGIQSNSNGPLPDRLNPSTTTTPGTKPNPAPTPKP
jgi:outer membrane protein assembly factor BamD